MADKPTGSPAATLIGIITLLFIFYILFLPAEERQQLLEGENYTDSDTKSTLLDETPGLLSFTKRTLFDHDIPSVFLSETKNAVVLSSENPFTVRKGWFSEQRKTIIFAVPSLAQTDNVILSLQAPTRAGTLVITLNGQTIYESTVATQNPPPITLPKTLISGANQLEFYVKGGFFSRTRYELFDVKVIGEVTDAARQAATSTFTISDVEKENLDTAFLDFYPLCDQNEVGTLSIELNDRIIHSAIPACEGLNRADLDKEELRDGKNTISFKINQGSYRVEQIRVRTILKPVKPFIDYFKINSTLYNAVLDNKRNVVLRIEFVDDDEDKQARLNINGKYDVIDQENHIYEEDISELIKEGNNYLQLDPLTELHIVRITVKAE
ncbi:hypothetical protein J4219_08330 [Candidatus Woesearchaeota archaeon]|nr:hypothetical protein [Candidatus Woesearchaeota archaeon]